MRYTDTTMIQIGINGFGRIGRALVLYILQHPDTHIHIAGINDLMSTSDAAYLFKYDSVRGVYQGEVSHTKHSICIDGKTIPFSAHREPKNCPWSALNVDIVIEATGVFASYEKAQPHQRAGAKHIIITAPVKDTSGDVSGETVVVGVNEEKLNVCTISSNASCTTNAVATPLQVLSDVFGVKHAVLTTVHAYTGSQHIVDSVHTKKQRLGRAGAVNIIPSSTGAAIATAQAIPSLEGKFDGVSLRVPVVCGSLADITAVVKSDTTVEAVNEALEKASLEPRYKGILGVTNEALVSSDILNVSYAALIDMEMTRVVDGCLVKLFSWYDNEIGYVNTLVKQIQKVVL